MIFESIKLAFQSIWAAKFRSVLTMLGIIIGISSVSLFLAVGAGLRRGVNDTVLSLGTNIVFAIPGKIDTANSASPNLISNDILKIDDVNDIAALPIVKTLTPMTIIGGVLRHDKISVPGSFIIAVRPTYLDVFKNLAIDQGRSFTTDEDRDKKKVLVLGSSTATTLFRDANPIDQRVSIGKAEFTVVGVTKTPASQSLVGGQDFSSLTLVPFATGADLNGSEKVFRIGIVVDPTADITDAKRQISDVLLKRHSTDDFSVVTQDDILGVLNGVLDLLTSAVAAIAAISLVVAGVGIMNIMLVSVTERTKEIGLRKAVGATTGAILWQFLTEAIVLSVLGALIAIGITLAATKIIPRFAPITPIVTPQAVELAVGVGVIVGLIFGLAPALRAANLDPIEALRHD